MRKLNALEGKIKKGEKLINKKGREYECVSMRVCV